MYGWAAQAFLDDDLQSLVSLGSNANHGGVWSNHLAALHEFKKSRKMRAVQFDLQVRARASAKYRGTTERLRGCVPPRTSCCILGGPSGPTENRKQLTVPARVTISTKNFGLTEQTLIDKIEATTGSLRFRKAASVFDAARWFIICWSKTGIPGDRSRVFANSAHGNSWF